MVKADIPVLFLNLREIHLVLPVEYDAVSRFVIYGLHYVEVCSLYSHLLRVFLLMGDGFYQVLFLHLLVHVIFTFHFFNVMYHI